MTGTPQAGRDVGRQVTCANVPLGPDEMRFGRKGRPATMTAMPELSNPSGLHETPGYHHVTTTDATRLVFLAGQCPLDAQGNLTGPGDLKAQVGQIVSNIEIALASAGATPADVVRTVIYVVSAEQPDLAEVWTILRGSAIASALDSASTLLGVAQLGFRGQLVEIDVTAALPG